MCPQYWLYQFGENCKLTSDSTCYSRESERKKISDYNLGHEQYSDRPSFYSDLADVAWAGKDIIEWILLSVRIK